MASRRLRILTVTSMSGMGILAVQMLASHDVMVLESADDVVDCLALQPFDVLLGMSLSNDAAIAAALGAARGQVGLRVLYGIDEGRPNTIVDAYVRPPGWGSLWRCLESYCAATERRREERMPVRLPILVKTERWTRRLFTEDVSAYGMAVISPEPTDAPVLDVVVPRRGRKALEFRAEVRNTAVVMQGALRVGMRLQSARPEAHAELSAMAERLAMHASALETGLIVPG